MAPTIAVAAIATPRFLKIVSIQKSELSLRPIWHQKAERVQAHIFVRFLGYVLWKTLEHWQVRDGLGNSPRAMLDELSRITSTDVVLPFAGAPESEVRFRCVVRPDKAQAALLDRPGLKLPKRLRIPPRGSSNVVPPLTLLTC